GSSKPTTSPCPSGRGVSSVTIFVGHRGAPTLATENTLASLRAAQHLGADAVEFDVRATKDGAAVLLHDRTLARLWGCDRPVAELTLAEVRELRGPAGELVPTLAEVIEAVSLQLVVDCKVPALVPEIVRLLRG